MEEVREVVSTEYIKPRECITDYDEYATLVSGEAEEDVKNFLSQPYTFQEILANIAHYQNLAEQIQYTSAEVKCVITAYYYKVGLNHANDYNCWRFICFISSNYYPFPTMDYKFLEISDVMFLIIQHYFEL